MGNEHAAGYVLVVEDDDANARALLRVLRHDGYTAESAGDADAALAMLAARTPDLILLDSQLPSMSGFELCRMLRARRETASTPIMFLTGLQTPETSIEAIEAGANLIVGKPYRAQDLRDRIRDLLLQKRDAERPESIDPPPAE